LSCGAPRGTRRPGPRARPRRNPGPRLVAHREGRKPRSSSRSGRSRTLGRCHSAPGRARSGLRRVLLGNFGPPETGAGNANTWRCLYRFCPHSKRNSRLMQDRNSGAGLVLGHCPYPYTETMHSRLPFRYPGLLFDSNSPYLPRCVIPGVTNTTGRPENPAVPLFSHS